MNLRKTAARLPRPVRQSLKYAYGALPPRIRYGRVFWETYGFLQESQWWSKERLQEYQLQELQKLIRHAYINVPYYTSLFHENGLSPNDIKGFDDLKKLPCLTKDILREEARGRLLAGNLARSKLSLNHTSGTTGKPLQFLEDSPVAAKELAFIHHQWSRVGYKPGDLRVELRGPVYHDKPFLYDPLTKVLRLSPMIDSKERAAYYLDKIRSTGARFLHGYPGTIASFALLIRDHDLLVPFTLKSIFFASEVVYPWQRELVQEVFQCRVFSHYGLSEKVALASECERSSEYHFVPQYGITEVDPDTGEIIATGFLNRATPFIRYKTTDIASTPICEGCDKCGRGYFPIIKNMEGRLGDFIVTPAGVPISPAIITHPFKDMATITNAQVVQKDLDHILIRVVPWNAASEENLWEELVQLSDNLRKIIGEAVEVQLEIVEEIERTSSGKFKWIISDVTVGLENSM